MIKGEGEGDSEGEGEGVLVLGPSHSTSRPDPSGNHLHRVISSRVSIPICRNRRLMALFRKSESVFISVYEPRSYDTSRETKVMRRGVLPSLHNA